MPDTNQPKELLRLLKPRLPQMLSTLQTPRPSRSLPVSKKLRGPMLRPARHGMAQTRCSCRTNRSETSWRPTSCPPGGRINPAPPANSSSSATTTPSIPPALSPKCPSASPRKSLWPRHIRHESRNRPSPLCSRSSPKKHRPRLRIALVFLWTSDEEIGSDCLAQTHRIRSSPQRRCLRP